MRATTVMPVAAALMLACGLALGYASAPTTASPNPIRLDHGVPVGVLDTPDGALAAADNYLAGEDNSLLSADGVRRAVDTVWAPQDRATELAQPFPAAALAGKPQTFPGLDLTAAVVAHRLESYTPQTARVAVWHEITIWSPTIAPTQRWMLDAVTLAWSSGRWLIASHASEPDAQTPVPAWTNGGAADRSTQAFGSRLAATSAPYYGAMP